MKIKPGDLFEWVYVFNHLLTKMRIYILTRWEFGFRVQVCVCALE